MLASLAISWSATCSFVLQALRSAAIVIFVVARVATEAQSLPVAVESFAMASTVYCWL